MYSGRHFVFTWCPHYSVFCSRVTVLCLLDSLIMVLIFRSLKGVVLRLYFGSRLMVLVRAVCLATICFVGN